VSGYRVGGGTMLRKQLQKATNNHQEAPHAPPKGRKRLPHAFLFIKRPKYP